MALIDAEYWRLLRDILAKISTQFRQLKRLGLATTGRTGGAHRVGDGVNAMLSSTVSGNLLVDFQAPTILLRVPVIPMFTALIQRLDSSSVGAANDSAAVSAPAKAKGKKGGQSNTAGGAGAAKSAKSLMEQRPSTAVLELANECFDLLLSSSMAEWFQPNLEQYTPLVHATLAVMTNMFQGSSAADASVSDKSSPSSSPLALGAGGERHEYSQEDKALLLSFAGLTLDQFKRLIVIQANQKKVFGLIAGKMFDSLVCARHAILPILNQESVGDEVNRVKATASLQQHAQICLDSIGAILRHGLFHQDHLQEYTSSLNISASLAGTAEGGSNDSEKAMQSYQKQLFDQIESMAKSAHIVAVLDVLPVLLTYFVEESRRRQRILASSGLDRSAGMDSTRSTEFKFFTELYVLAKKQLPELSGTIEKQDNIKRDTVERAVHVIRGLNQLLGNVANLQMYQSSNDAISKAQYAFLETCFRTMSKYLTKADDLKDPLLQTVALQGLVRLAKLDDLILEAHLSRLWPTLLSPLSGNMGPHATAKELACVLLETHGKSRQLGQYIVSLLKAMHPFLSNPEQLESSPILSRGFLDHIPDIVRLHLPLAQAPFILEEFVSEIKSHIMTSDTPTDIPKATKKRKLNSGSHDNSDEKSIRSAGMVVALLVPFLKGLRITATHQKQILHHFSTLFTDFISPVLQQTISTVASTESLSKQFQERRLAPALQLHYALCKASTQYWEQALSTETLVKLTTTMAKSKNNTDFVVEDSVTLLLNRIVLQHVHLCLCSAQITMDEALTKTCQDLVAFTMTTCRLQELTAAQDGELSGVTARWDGSLSSAKGPSFLVASWQTQVNDWLDIVCRFGSIEAMTLLANVITDNVFSSSLSLTGNSSTTLGSNGELTLQSLNQVLLRSANMYEVARFRPVLVDTVLSKLIAILRDSFHIGRAKRNKEQDLIAMVESILQQTQTSGPSYQEIVKAYAQWLSNEMESSSTTASKNKKSKTAGKNDTFEQEGRLLSLLSILHLLPIEYLDKRERDCILVLMGVLDLSIQKCMPGNVAGLQSLLLCRKVSLAMMLWRNDAGLLATDPVMVQELLHYIPWCVSRSEDGNDGTTQDIQRLGNALWKTTSSMVQSLVHHSMLLATGSGLDEHAGQQVIALLDLLYSWTQDKDDKVFSLEQAKVTVDESLSVPRIRLCILAKSCQSLVQSLEHLVSTITKKKKKASTATDAQKEYERRTEKASKLAGRIQDLFRQLETKTLSHLSKVILSPLEALPPSSPDSHGEAAMAMEVDDDTYMQSCEDLVQACQVCLDHFGLLKTLLDFSALVKKSEASQLTLFNATASVVTKPKGAKDSAKSKPVAHSVESQDFLLSLYRVADWLINKLDLIKKQHGDSTLVKNLVHLISILTAYTCQYLPQSSDAATASALSEDQVKGLLTLILRVSEFGAITLEDMVALKDSYLAMLGHLPVDMFEKMLEYLLSDRAYSCDHETDDALKSQQRGELILVKLLEVTFLGSHQSQKRKVRKHIPKLVARMIRILQTSASVEVVVEVLELLAGVCSELAFELRPWEIGLILEAVTTLMSPATPLLLGSVVDVQSQPSQQPSSSKSTAENGNLKKSDVATSTATLPKQYSAVTASPSQPHFTTNDAVRVFTGVYHILTHIARFRQEELVELIPIFTAILQAIFHGFKSIHPSIARKQQGIHALMASQNPFPLLTHRCLVNQQPAHAPVDEHPQRGNKSGNRKHNDTSPSLSSLTFSQQTFEEPLPVECAENFARLLTTLGTKAVMTSSYGGGGNTSMDLEPPSTTADGTTAAAPHHRVRQQPLDTSKAFSKHAPYLLTEYFKIQSSVVASISQLPLRQALLPGLYALMDLCSEWERELMMANLDATGKSLLKNLYSDYLKYHKYTGR
ncbi:hypothetical protein BGW42_006134 [Actinomortierella wolfii]|nr:hypothetical protein BGW42_006134 [Actinomortierella wolfii]